jgi:intraflagellar transport protein 57
MADDERGDGQAVQQLITIGGPVTIDDASMLDLLDKLKMLNYEIDFCQAHRPPFKVLHKSYFVQGGSTENASNQFFYFTSLVSWLMSAAGHKGFPPPGQYDDPNATSTNILTELRVMGLPVTNLAPNRVRTGNGDAVLTILCLLVDKALIAKGFSFQPVEYTMEKYDETAEDDRAGRSGGIAEEGDIDDHVAVDSEDDDEVYVHAGGSRQARDENQAIVSQVSAEQWQLEVERVGPQLQVRSEDLKDWRARIEGANTLLKAVEKMYPDVKTMLQRMGDDLDKSMDRIQKREQSLAQQFSEHVEEYRAKLRELNSSQDLFNQASQSVTQLSQELNHVSESLDNTKREIEEREARISDTTPLMQIKDAVSRVRNEIKQMSLRIGVLQHTVLHYTLRQSKVKREGRTSEAQYDDDAEFVL